MTEYVDENDMNNKKSKKVKTGNGINGRNVDFTIAVIVVFITMVVLISYSILSGPKSHMEHTTSDGIERSSYDYDEQSPLSESWVEDEKHQYLVNTPGASVAATDNYVMRINPDDGSSLWSYGSDNSKVCHIVESEGNIVALFDNGKGCTDISLIDATNGKIINQAQYFVEDKDSDVRLIAERGKIAIVSEKSVRLLRDDLVPSAEFGDKADLVYADDQKVSDCTISDVNIGPDSFAVASKCSNDDGYHVRIVDNEPEESTQGKIILDVDTAVDYPVTIPVITKSMFNFIVDGPNPTLYTWQLDKDKNEVSNEPLSANEYSHGYINMEGIGYVWRVGNTLYARHGSEDISQYKTKENVIGNPIQIENKMIVPQKDSINIWDSVEDNENNIPVDNLDGRYFSFAGSTLISLDGDGKLKGYSPR